MTELGRDDTETAGTMFNNWAFALQLSGLPLEAEKYYRRALEISRTENSDEGVSPMLLVNYARALRELGRHAEAADYADRAYAKAQHTDDQVVIMQSLFVGARIYREQGNRDRAEAMLAELEPRLRKAYPPGNLAFATLATEHSLLALARGDSPSAMQQANQAVEITEAAIKSGQGGDDYLARVLVPRSDVERLLGRADQAATDAARAVTILQKSAEPKSFTSYLGHAYYTLGLALQAQGKSEEARAAFRSAAEHLQAALGQNYPDTRRARQLAAPETQH
jgi:tetratricopeptide (TPR) repeat protein